MNDPQPKGGYQAIIQMVQYLGQDDPQEPEALASRLDHFGYQVKENGEEESPALSKGNYTYTELCEVLGFAEENSGKLELTEDTTGKFEMNTSGNRLYEILTSEKTDRVKSAEISSLILLELCGHDVRTRSVNIPDAFKQFLQQLWDESNRDEDTGRYQTPRNLEQIETALPTDWNRQKLRYCRQRGTDLGVCRRGSTSGNDMLFPVLSQDIFQAVVFHLYEYYREDVGDSTPNMISFYEDLQEWYPIAESFFEDNVLFRGLLERDGRITEESYPILRSLLNQREEYDGEDFRVKWLEGEDNWSEEIRYAEFEFQVI